MAEARSATNVTTQSPGALMCASEAVFATAPNSREASCHNHELSCNGLSSSYTRSGGRVLTEARAWDTPAPGATGEREGSGPARVTDAVLAVVTEKGARS
jgi:hypothetical protein